MKDSSVENAPPISRTALLCYLPGLLVALAALSVRAVDTDFGESFGGGQLGMNGAGYTARIADNVADERYPLGLMRCAHPFVIWPTEPPLIEYYQRHPAGYFFVNGLLCRIFGASARVLQVGATLVFLCTVLAISGLLGARRPVAGGVAGVVAAGIPLGSHYGFMVSTHGVTLLLAILVLLAYRRWVSGGGKGALFALALCATLMCQADWWGYMLFPALALDLLLFHRPIGWRKILILLVLGVGNLLLTFLHFVWIFDGFASALERFSSMAGGAAQSFDRAGPGDLAWYRAVGEHLVTQATLPVLGLTLCGAIRECFTRGGRTVLLLALFGILNQLLLSGYAYTHEFWVYMFLPLLGLGCGSIVEVALRENLFVRAILCLGLLAIAAFGIHDAHTQFVRERRQVERVEMPAAVTSYLDSVSDPDDIVFTTMSTLHTALLARSLHYGPVVTEEGLKVEMSKLSRRTLRGRMLFVLPATQRDLPIARYLDATYPRLPNTGVLRVHLLRAR